MRSVGMPSDRCIANARRDCIVVGVDMSGEESSCEDGFLSRNTPCTLAMRGLGVFFF